MEELMRFIVPCVAAIALAAAASVSYAADATGMIKSLDPAKDMITLDNGSTFVAPTSVKLSEFKVGEKVRVDYTKSGDKMEITSIKPMT
jgi:Cu/Ag efflux protein CusF